MSVEFKQKLVRIYHKKMRVYILFILYILGGGGICAQDHRNSELVPFLKTLRCPDCQAQRLYEANTPEALKLKTQIQTLYRQGYSQRAIEEALIQSFGQKIFFDSKSEKLKFIAIPYLLLFFIIVKYIYVRSLRLKKSSLSNS